MLVPKNQVSGENPGLSGRNKNYFQTLIADDLKNGIT